MKRISVGGINKLRASGVFADNLVTQVLGNPSNWAAAFEAKFCPNHFFQFPLMTPVITKSEEFFGDLVGRNVYVEGLVEFFDGLGVSARVLAKIEAALAGERQIPARPWPSRGLLQKNFQLTFDLEDDTAYAVLEVSINNALFTRFFSCECLESKISGRVVSLTFKGNPEYISDTYAWKQLIEECGLNTKVSKVLIL